MNKSDLIPGVHLVKQRDGSVSLVVSSEEHGMFLIDRDGEGYLHGNSLKEDLKIPTHPDFDIMAVYIMEGPTTWNDLNATSSNQKAVWERKEDGTVEYTIADLEKHFGHKVKVVGE